MQYIFGCKMYMNRSQAEQAQIRASLSSPINVELVKQLAEYLDDEYLEDLIYQSKAAKAEKAAEAREDESEIAEDTFEEPEGSHEPSRSSDPVLHAAPSDNDNKISDLLKDEEFKDEDSTAPTPAAPEPSADSEPVGQSTALHGSAVTCADVKTLLENTADAQGVARVQIRGSETWIHYSDTTNLNNVMEPVIACMNAAYPSLHFNRLARTENAVVFSN